MAIPGPEFRKKHARLSAGMQTIAKTVTKAIKKEMGAEEAANISFSLFIWHADPESGGSWVSYVATADRGGVRTALEVMLAKWKQGEPMPPLHEMN